MAAQKTACASKGAERGRTRLATLLALTLGLFVAWWTSFHEIACGCISIRTTVPLLYTFSSCYAHSVGSIVGAVAFWFLASHEKAMHAVAGLSPKAVLYTLLGVCAALTATFFALLVNEAYATATVVQVLVNAVAIVAALAGLLVLFELPLSDSMLVVASLGLAYILVDNVAEPLLVAVGGGFAPLSAGLLAVLAACAFSTHALLGHEDLPQVAKRAYSRVSKEVASRSASEASSARAMGARDKGLPWQLLFHLCVYSFLFGLMHVESSSLITDFYSRDLPYLAGALAALALFYTLFIRRSATSFIYPKVRNVVLPLTAVSFLLLPSLEPGLASFPSVALIDCAYIFYDFVFVLAVFAIARQSNIPLTRMLCVGVVVKFTAYLVGIVVCHVGLLTSNGFDVLRTPLAGVAVLVLLVAATLWIGDDKQVAKIWGRRIELSPKSMADATVKAKCAVVAKNARLTPKEAETLALLLSGDRAQKIADDLFVSVNTVRTHMRNIYAKVGVHSLDELTERVNAVSLDDVPVEALPLGSEA